MCLRTSTLPYKLGFVKGLPKFCDALEWTCNDLLYLCAMIPQSNCSIYSFTYLFTLSSIMAQSTSHLLKAHSLPGIILDADNTKIVN